MGELELTRTPGDRRRFALAGIGTVRFEGLASRSASAEAGGRAWRFGRVGFWRRRIEATDEAGAVVGAYDPRGLGRGGTLSWSGRELALRPASRWRERYALVDGERELAHLDGKGWGKRPVKIGVKDPAVDPGLLLFAAFIVRGLAEDAGAAAGATASTST